MTDRITVVPSARRLMESLRDIGYDLPAAVADLVDNSLDAGARNVDVTLTFDGSDSWIRIADDGQGMTARELDEAMRYGSASSYGDHALGHFGLGLKTGSLSQCRRLTVASRRGPRGRLGVRRWDLDAVAESDSWDLEIPAGDLSSKLTDPLEQQRGTVVLWEKLDRVLGFRNPSGAPAAKAVESLVAEVGAHLAMVFHRFLSGEFTDGHVAVALTINDQAIEAWDPFARNERHTRELPAQTIALGQADGTSADLSVRPFVLPSQTQFSSPEAHRVAAGPKRWNHQQGFYIYRRERLIQSGGWNRLRTLDEHAKLARIAVDLPLGQEDLFGINVAKMRVSIPEVARASLRTIASAVVQDAQRSYRDHLHQALPPLRDTGVPDALGAIGTLNRGVDGPSISGDWPVILRAVDGALGDDRARRDEVLRALANALP